MVNPMLFDLEHTAGEIIQCGTIASVDYEAALCTVAIGDLETGDLPWFAPCAGSTAIWSPPVVGEQCAVLSPEGDLANGLVLLGLFSNRFPAPSQSPDLMRVTFPDGAALSYDHQSHALALEVGSGSLAITAKGGITIDGDVSVTGKITASDDVIGGGTSLKSHKHLGVSTGSAQSGGPA